ncbi:hypothetical protein C8C85_1659 [Flavobacterium sp. 103]|uniref:cache domain-containing protein n=1 Tax=Flavobacterium sp. 103 TaxID=2135624 RepID=UPI000D5E9794|nr:cache domain-containing protein [Flavobacterium sp. 103]PVX45852.1 hypothetical protein C8C85_1659 [Flavobacterium sp. 103]
MSLLTPFFDKLKSHNYSIITAIIIGIITGIYLLIIVPNNEIKEDANNLAVFKGIERQLKGFFDDKVKEISPEIRDSIIAKNRKLGNDSVFIDKIEIVRLDRVDSIRKKLQLIRKINFKKNGDLKIIATVTDTVQFDLDEFIKRVSTSSNFNSFFICPVTLSGVSEKNGKCLAKDVLISQNINLKDEDSLCFYNRNNGNITFKKSDKRYYTSQIKIPDTNFTLFVAAGISSSYFQSNVQFIKPNLLIFSLLLIAILFLSICFIKPVVSSYKERLSQMDLITVAFSTGALIALFVIFGMVGFWKTTISNRNKSDLKQLVEHIDLSFKNQIDTLQHWKGNQIPNDINGSKFPYRKLYLVSDSKVSMINGDSIVDSISFSPKNKILKLNAKSFNKADSLEQIKCLDSYFWMDKGGLLTASLNKDNISFPRKYNDRKYFKLLQNKEIDTILTGVFSRESDEYQWIYAEKDVKKNNGFGSEKSAIKGIAFREHFSKEIKLPPDTDYLLVDREGFVLMQNNPNKNLYQNVLSGSHNNLVLASILAGCNIENFRMDYEGNEYQVYAKKLSVPTDLPVYILGMRNLSYLDYLSLFTFNNAFLITVLYGFLIVLFTLIYSSLFYSGRLGLFSRHHFYYLFPDNSRKEEYQNLFVINIICFCTALAVFFFSSPITALYFCFLIGINITFINIIVLNIRCSKFENSLLKFYLLVIFLGFVFPLLLLYKDQLYLSFIFVVGSHLGLILYYRNWRNWKDIDSNAEIANAVAKNKGVQRKVYLKFLTSGLINYFVVFPFILVCAFYSNEINDYARYYCSPSQPQSKFAKHKIISAYGCDCKPQTVFELGKNNEGVIHKLNFGFEQPTMSEVNKYTFKKLHRNFYIKTNTILLNGGSNLFYFILCFTLILLLTNALLNYYSNRFFFYELMQASYEGYYPCKKNLFANEYIFIPMVNDEDLTNMIQKDMTNPSSPDAESVLDPNCADRIIPLEKVFEKDNNNEVLPFLKMEFILNSNLKNFDKAYLKIWDSIPNTEMQNVLYDFAQDHFLNYKNKDILMQLMDLGLINHDKLTGRLKVMSYSFRVYIMSKSKLDTEFVKQFEDESKNGTYDKLKLPILIIAISFLVLLMYLNKDSYERVMIMGSSIGSVILLVNKFLDFGKS